MSTKKYLDDTGLQYYHEKLQLDLTNATLEDKEIKFILYDILNILPDEWTVSSNGSLNLSTSNTFVYEPEGAGTKNISITNAISSNKNKFFLKIIDGGNFIINWDNTIRWPNNEVPYLKAFTEDIFLFETENGGTIWNARLIQSIPIDPYWKITVNAQHNDTTGLQYQVPANWGMFVYLPFPSNELPEDAVVDWGDGTIQTHNQFEYDTNVEVAIEKGNEHTGVLKHTYTTEGIYHIKIQASTFKDIYMVGYISGDSFVYDSYYSAGVSNITSIDSPLPEVKGVWTGGGSAISTEDNALYAIFSYESLSSIPEKLFYNNPKITTLNGVFDYTPQLYNFTLYINAFNINNISYMIRNNHNATPPPNVSRIIYVPCNSTTHQTFTNAASNFSLTVMCEEYTWIFTVNTELFGSNESAVPFYLHSDYNDVTLYVDWGDGETSTLTKNDYSHWYFYNSISDAINNANGDIEDLDTAASIHLYEEPGIYTIKVRSTNWKNMYLLLNITDYEYSGEASQFAGYIWKQTLVSFDNAVPQMKGIMNYETVGAYPDECWVEDGFEIYTISDLSKYEINMI